MNEQLDNTGMVERTDKNLDSQEVNSDPFSDKVPVDPSITHEASWGKTDIHETPKEEKVVQEMPVDGTGVHETPMDVSIAHETPMGETIVHEKLLSVTSVLDKAPIITKVPSPASLFNPEESEQFRARWNEIQGKFVDEPRSAIEQADALVSEVIEQITQRFTNEHSLLEGKWKQGNDVSTEELRIALQHYRSFFNRLVV